MKMDKKNSRMVAVILLAFMMGSLVTLKLTSSTDDTQTDHSKTDHPKTDHPKTEEATTWICSMHPQIKLPTKGDCPICGMDLIPLETETSSEGIGGDGVANFKMSDYAKALARVETTPVRFENPVYISSFLGEIDWNEKTIKTQTAWFSGRIEKLHVSYTGQTVRKGAPVATIYSPELFSVAEEWRQAKKSKREPLINSVRRKLKLLGFSKNEIKNLGSVKSERFVLRATVTGVVTKLRVEQGVYVKRGEVVLTVAQTGLLWVQIELYEKDLSVVKLGDFVKIKIPNSFITIDAKIVFIDPVVDKFKRTAKARIEIKNSTGLLKPGMLVEAIVTKTVNQKELLVPATSLLFTGKRAVVYVEKNENYQLREVEVGKRYGEVYAVYGVEEGERVVSRGAFKIDAARQIKALPSMIYPADAIINPITDSMAELKHSKNNTENNKENNKEKNEEKNEENNKKNSKKSHKVSQKMDINKLTVAETNWLNEIYNGYLPLQVALRSDDVKTAFKQAQKMLKPLTSPPKKFSTNEKNRVILELHKISKESKIEDIRAYFLHLSNWIISSFERHSFRPKAGGSIFFCPMANNNRGAEWIQQESEVLNPYWGEMMISCGEVRREAGVKAGVKDGSK